MHGGPNRTNKAAFSIFSRLKSVFEKLRFRDRLLSVDVWPNLKFLRRSVEAHTEKEKPH